MKQEWKRTLRSAAALLHEKRLIPVPMPIDTNKLLDGKVALITGGSGGVGFAMAKAFVNSGCKVIIGGTKEEKLSACCRKLGEGIQYIVLDVCNISAMPEQILCAADKFEDGRIDILVNSAGVISHSDFFHMKEDEYDAVMDINLKGTFFMCQAMGRYMMEKGIKGHILNVSSSSALRPANSPYRISKWSIRGFTLGLAELLLPYGIIVNAIAPGPVATEMMGRKEGDSLYKENQPSGRYAAPDEIANLAVFMVSDMGDLIVGDTFYMTGGSGTISSQF